MTPRTARRRFGGTLALALAAPAALAQGLPTGRTLKIVVPWAPGGLVDTGGRVVAEALGKALGTPAVVENVPGAAGTLGAQQVARAAADGTTLLMGTSSIAIDVAGGRKLAFDPLRDLAPVALVADSPSVVVVPAASPFHTLAELIAQARARPGALDYGTPGVGSPAHLFTELFAQTAGLRLQHVPYGRMPAINDLLGGTLHLMVATIPVALPHVQGGRLRALAVTGRQRFGALPQVPTVAEAGLAGFEAGQFLAVFAPGPTPAGTIRRLADEIARAVGSPETGAQFAARGLVPLSGGPAELAQRLAAETRTWARVMKDGDIRLDT